MKEEWKFLIDKEKRKNAHDKIENNKKQEKLQKKIKKEKLQKKPEPPPPTHIKKFLESKAKFGKSKGEVGRDKEQTTKLGKLQMKMTFTSRERFGEEGIERVGFSTAEGPGSHRISSVRGNNSNRTDIDAKCIDKDREVSRPHQDS